MAIAYAEADPSLQGAIVASPWCPLCLVAEAKFLPASSEAAVVNYYRCASCGHVWTVPKSHPDAQPKPVTDAKERPSE